MPGTLYIVGTPLGNLGDMSPRALATLASVDAVLAEDTRVTARLLAHGDIHVPLERCDENVITRRTPELVERLAAGQNLAFCSDAGMPCISDPGTVLVDAVRTSGLDIDVQVIPGPTAVTTALAVAGLSTDAFYFGGFLPRKVSERVQLLETFVLLPATLVFYESPYRVVAALEDIAKVFPRRRVCLARELTKLHEEELIGTADQLLALIKSRDGRLKGEMVLIIEAGGKGLADAPEGLGSLSVDEQANRIAEVLAGCTGSRSAVARQAAHALGLPKQTLYDAMCENDGAGICTEATVRAIMDSMETRGDTASDDDGDIR